jgi:sigma-B regulation protein RsbU (phosphoserine phosphatase)
MEARSSQFLTVFYGVLDPGTGRLDYSSAGHCPPYLLRGCDSSQDDQNRYGNSDVQELVGQGMPLGMSVREEWPSETVQLDPGDVLVLYTDGITEARNARREFFGEGQLLNTLTAHRADQAQQIEDAILRAVNEFVDGSIRSDDITLAVVVRNR